QLGLDGKLGNGLHLRYGSEFFVGGHTNIGTSDVAGDFIMEEGARLIFDVGSVANDLLLVNGDAQLANGVVIEVRLGEGMPVPGTYFLAQMNEGLVFLPGQYEVVGLTGVPYELK